MLSTTAITALAIGAGLSLGAILGYGVGYAGARKIFKRLNAELTGAVVTLKTAELPGTLENIQNLCKALATTVSLTHDDLKITSQQLQAVEAGSSAALEQLVAMLASRAQMLDEVARLTGQQVQHSLSQIVGAQAQFKQAGQQGAQLMAQYGYKLDEISERLLAATNVLRASGKVLNETVDGVRARMLDAAATITQTDARLTHMVEQSGEQLHGLATQAAEILAKNTAGQAALDGLLAAGEKIGAIGARLELSEADLGKAIATLLAQGDKFVPLSEQLRALHHELITHITKQVAEQEAVMIRLENQTSRLEQFGAQLEDAVLQTALDKLARLGQLTDSLAQLLAQAQDITPLLQQASQQLGSMNETAIGQLTAALTENTAATEMNALRINANLQLVRDQIGDLLHKLSLEQTQLLGQIHSVEQTFAALRGEKIEKQHLDEVVDVLARQIGQQYEKFTGDLAGFIMKFEQALAMPLLTSADDSMSGNAQQALGRLRSALGATMGAAAGTAPATAASMSLKDALARVQQIKKLTAALAGTTEQVAALTLNEQLGDDAGALANQAKTLIDEVMGALSNLAATAQNLGGVGKIV